MKYSKLKKIVLNYDYNENDFIKIIKSKRQNLILKLFKKIPLNREYIKLFEKGCKLKNGSAYNNLACMYYYGTHPDGINTKKAVELYEKGCELKNGNAYNNLAKMYEKGIHPDGKDTKKAVKLYKKAYELKIGDAYYNLACMYENGTHPDGKDIEKSIELFEKSFYLKTYNSISKMSKYFLEELYDFDKYETMYNNPNSEPYRKDIIKPIKMKKIYTNIETDICVICRNTLMYTSDSIITMVCGHSYHLKCYSKLSKCVFKCN